MICRAHILVSYLLFFTIIIYQALLCLMHRQHQPMTPILVKSKFCPFLFRTFLQPKITIWLSGYILLTSTHPVDYLCSLINLILLCIVNKSVQSKALLKCVTLVFVKQKQKVKQDVLSRTHHTLLYNESGLSVSNKINWEFNMQPKGRKNVKINPNLVVLHSL